MDDGSRLPDMAPWLVAIVLLIAAMYFAVTETAIASASHSKIKAAADRGDDQHDSHWHEHSTYFDRDNRYGRGHKTLGHELGLAEHHNHNGSGVFRG